MMREDERILAYAERHSTAAPAILEELFRETHLSQVYPQMLSGHLQGALLGMICRMVRPDRVLEIGTFTGYSALAMGFGLDLGRAGNPKEMAVIHTIEINPEFEEGIRNYIRKAGMEGNIILHTGDAMEVIPRLNEPWDLVFIDADKSNYLNYYKAVFPMVRPGGYIIADNVLWDGKVLDDSSKADKDTLGIMSFNAFVADDERVETVFLPFRDGLMLVRKLAG